MYIVFLDICYCTLNRQYYVNVTFIHTGEPKNLCDSFTARFALLRWSGTEPVIPLKPARMDIPHGHKGINK